MCLLVCACVLTQSRLLSGRDRSFEEELEKRKRKRERERERERERRERPSILTLMSVQCAKLEEKENQTSLCL